MAAVVSLVRMRFADGLSLRPPISRAIGDCVQLCNQIPHQLIAHQHQVRRAKGRAPCRGRCVRSAAAAAAAALCTSMSFA